MPAKKVEIICGYHAVRQVLARRSHGVLEVYISTGRERSVKLDGLLDTCAHNAISVQPIARAKLDRLTGVDNHQGIAARCRQDHRRQRLTLDDLCARLTEQPGIILALDRVLDPHNLGACLRTADAVGVTAVVLPKNHSAPLNATVHKVASGALESVNVITVTNLARSLRRLRDAGCVVIGTSGDADGTLYELDVRFPVLLVMGSEGAGLRRNTREHCDHLVKIPMHGSVESLNLSVAAGVCLYELRRRGNGNQEFVIPNPYSC